MSPLNSQKKAPPRPWFLAQLVPMVAGASYHHQLVPQCAYSVPAMRPVAGQLFFRTL
ncbi:hypothetical protein SGLAM104S_06119 [Streptomyces glaucescens]